MAGYANRVSARVVVLCLLVALAAAGCDVGEQAPPKPTYSQQVRAVLDRFAKGFRPASGDLSDVPALSREANRSASSLETAARGLAALRPPARLRSLHNAAVAAFRNQGELYAALSEELAASSSRAEAERIVARYQQRLTSVGAQSQLTIQRLAGEVS